MAIKEQFTSEDWQTLQLTLAEVTNAVMTAAPGGELWEKLSRFSDQEAALEQFPNNTLVHELFAQSDEEASALQELLDDKGKRTAQAARVDALYLCHRAIELLRAKNLDAPAVDGFRGVALFLATKVANAAKEGGVLGIGGERVTDAESAILKDLETALT